MRKILFTNNVVPHRLFLKILTLIYYIIPNLTEWINYIIINSITAKYFVGIILKTSQLLLGSSDFLGLNYYTTMSVVDDDSLPLVKGVDISVFPQTDLPITAMPNFTVLSNDFWNKVMNIYYQLLQNNHKLQ